MEATCEVCGSTFEAKRATRRTCSEACKKRAQRAVIEEPTEEPVIGSPSLEEIIESGVVHPAGEVESPEYIRDMKDQPHVSEHRDLPWNKPASKGGNVYPGREKPSGTVMWGEHTSAPQRSYRVVRNCSISEDAYVKGELMVTKAQMDAGMLKEVIDPLPGPGKGKGRMWRCERYARWRYRGFLAGQIATL